MCSCRESWTTSEEYKKLSMCPRHRECVVEPSVLFLRELTGYEVEKAQDSGGHQWSFLGISDALGEWYKLIYVELRNSFMMLLKELRKGKAARG